MGAPPLNYEVLLNEATPGWLGADLALTPHLSNVLVYAFFGSPVVPTCFFVGSVPWHRYSSLPGRCLPGPSGGVSHAALLLLLLVLPLCSLLGPVSCGCLNVCPLVVCCAFTCVHLCPPVWHSGDKFRLLFSTFGACPL